MCDDTHPFDGAVDEFKIFEKYIENEKVLNSLNYEC